MWPRALPDPFDGRARECSLPLGEYEVAAGGIGPADENCPALDGQPKPEELSGIIELYAAASGQKKDIIFKFCAWYDVAVADKIPEISIDAVLPRRGNRKVGQHVHTSRIR
jgi:hypothetical protein